MPSPPIDVLDIGPVSISLYGLCVMLGFLAWVFGTAWIWGKGGGDPIAAAWVCVYAAPGALVGARLYSVATEVSVYRSDPSQVVAVAQGGLGIYGAVLGAVMTIAIVAGARRWPVATFLDCAVVFLPLGQAIGRFGNWFNQELYGGPTSLPWGLEIDEVHRLPGYEGIDRYHPTFLYESLWCLVCAFILARAFRPLHARFRPGAVAALYLVLYGAGRFVVEGLRIDPAIEIGPLRLNQVISLGVIATGLLLLAALDRRRDPRR